MTVKMLLACTDAEELDGWYLYEQSEGHFGTKWDRQMVARQDKFLQVALTHDFSKTSEASLPWLDIPVGTEEERKAREDAAKQAQIAALDRALGAKPE